jgi:hypothetical protein
MEVWTGFIVGFVGSLHCVGMCGPIALALPVFGESKLQIFIGRVLYNMGRIITYALLGALFGLFGSRLILFGLQQNVSIAIGIIILLYVLIPRKIKTRVSEFAFYKAIVNFLRINFSRLISKKNNRSMFTIGLLNGLLPCGFVYVGIAGAVSTNGWMEGSLYMALFGAGTAPIMLATSMLGRIINFNLRSKINKLIPTFAVVLALLFILRGLNLGIPYLSPKFEYPAADTQSQGVDCCH